MAKDNDLNDIDLEDMFEDNQKSNSSSEIMKKMKEIAEATSKIAKQFDQIRMPDLPNVVTMTWEEKMAEMDKNRADIKELLKRDFTTDENATQEIARILTRDVRLLKALDEELNMNIIKAIGKDGFNQIEDERIENEIRENNLLGTDGYDDI